MSFVCGCLWVMCFSGEKKVSISLQALLIQHKANIAAALASLQKLLRTINANRVHQKDSNFWNPKIKLCKILLSARTVEKKSSLRIFSKTLGVLVH